MGLDGFRLDAVPYLYERPGTNGENLPETHAFLKKVRSYIDDNYPGRVLLAEANQWPADVVDYFGGEEGPDGDWIGTECHMCFHFPVMPRIFMAVRRESRYPISEILEQTPGIPSGCQWGIFLRNHDELTLEMVTDEDRDYMWGEYAKDPRMKANIGIRRRLAPLLDNDVNQIELFSALLLSLPGSPVLYYGDEIGMGDNIWLGDRDGVRTPMQWTPDRNAGFSSANPGRLHLPLIQDPVFGYQSVNVEAQIANASSLLHWTRRMIHARRQHDAFGLGHLLRPGRLEPVGAVVRPRARRRGRRHRHHPVRQQPVPVPPAGGARPEAVGGDASHRAPRRRPVPPDRRAALPAHRRGLRVLLVPADRTPWGGALVNDLVAFLAHARWFGGKGRPFRVTGTHRIGVVPGCPPDGVRAVVDLAVVEYDDAVGGVDLYQLPLSLYRERQGWLDHAQVGHWEDGELGEVYAYDSLHDREAMGCWLRSFAAEESGPITFHRVPGHDLDLEAHSTLFSGEQSNSSVAFGEDSLLKVFRRVTPGSTPTSRSTSS